MSNAHKWCFACAKSLPAPVAERAALIRAKKWTPGELVTVSFLDGSAVLHKRVKSVAEEWVGMNMANLKFIWNEPDQTDIRISFRHSGSWSYLGTDCRNIPRPDATMNYGWLSENSDEDELRRVVLHEFGHALGLTHEHLNPMDQVDWNKENVIADLSGPPNNWDLETISRNMFDAPRLSEVNATQVDVNSIMMYPFPAHWTNDGGSAGLNTGLSAQDIEFIKEQYPW
ncbi:MAG: hypothetical protein AAGC96_14585 [Pseudomonadota bacterium]